MAEQLTTASLLAELDEAAKLALTSNQPAAIAAISRARLAVLEQQAAIKASSNLDDCTSVEQVLDALIDEVGAKDFKRIARMVEQRAKQRRLLDRRLTRKKSA